MDAYGGLCVGGPYDGQKMTHSAKTRKLYRPLPNWTLDGDANVIEIGEYRLNDFGQWHWWETEEGKAYNTLHATNG